MSNSIDKSHTYINMMNSFATMDPETEELIKHRIDPVDDFSFDRRGGIGATPIYYQDFLHDLIYNNEKVHARYTLTKLSIIRNINRAMIKSEAYFGSDTVNTSGDSGFYTAVYNTDSGDPNFVSTNNTVRHLTVIDDSFSNFTPAYIIYPTNYTSILNLEVTSSNPSYEVTGYKPVHYVDSKYVNRTAILISIRVNNAITTSVKTNDNNNLNIMISNAWLDQSEHTFTLSLTGRAVIIAGTENMNSVSSQNIVTQADLIELKDAINSLKTDTNQLLDMIKALNAEIQKSETGIDTDLVGIIKEMSTSGVSNSSVIKMFSLLCQFADKIGVPYVKKFSEVMNAIYNSLTNSSVHRRDIVAENPKAAAVFQETNGLSLDVIMNHRDAGLIDLEGTLDRLVDIIEDSGGKYATVTMFGTDAFGVGDVLSDIYTNYGQGARKMRELVGRYPIHIYLLIKEHDPEHPDDPDSRLLRMDPGMDVNRKVISGEFSKIPYSFDTRVYTTSTVPNDIVTDRMKGKLIPLKTDVCAFSFDKIVEIANKVKSNYPEYELLSNNCQDMSAALYDMIVNGELGILNMLEGN